MEKVTPRTLSGFMELLPGEQVIFDAMSDRLRRAFSLYGYTPLDTPLIESSEVLLAKAGGETEKQVYRFMKGSSDLSLRFDLTVPLAKYVAANYASLSFPFRRYQIGKVYRGERAQRGRFREFYQADIDIIGDGGLDIINEAEIPSVIYRSFNALGLDGFVIRLNNRKILTGIFHLLGLTDCADEILRAVDKLDKIGADMVSRLLVGELGIQKSSASEIISLLTCAVRGEEPLGYLERYRGENDTLDRGIRELRAVMTHIADFGVPETHCKIDLTIARGLDYYTGTVYETTLLSHPEVGSICSGGRYDDLAGYYTDRKLPGVGISIGLTRLFFILSEQGYLNPGLPTSPSDVLVIPMTDDPSSAIALATEMRRNGLRVQIMSERKKLKQKITYADRLKIPFVAFLGDDEIAGGAVTVKKLETGAQMTATWDAAIGAIKSKLISDADIPPIKEPTE